MSQDSARIALAARIHVLLRRKTGRVTDTEWMAQNVAYASEVVRLCRADGDEELVALATSWTRPCSPCALAWSAPWRPSPQRRPGRTACWRPTLAVNATARLNSATSDGSGAEPSPRRGRWERGP